MKNNAKIYIYKKKRNSYKITFKNVIFLILIGINFGLFYCLLYESCQTELFKTFTFEKFGYYLSFFVPIASLYYFKMNSLYSYLTISFILFIGLLPIANLLFWIVALFYILVKTKILDDKF